MIYLRVGIWRLPDYTLRKKPNEKKKSFSFNSFFFLCVFPFGENIYTFPDTIHYCQATTIYYRSNRENVQRRSNKVIFFMSLYMCVCVCVCVCVYVCVCVLHLHWCA